MTSALRLALASALAAALAFSLGIESCTPQLRWVSPATGDVIATFDFSAQLATDGLPTGQLQVTLNGAPVSALVEGPPGVFTVSLVAGDPLLDHDNVLVARIPDAYGGAGTRASLRFDYLPPGKARAFQLTDPGDLITGPLAHNRLGDVMLANDVARFVVQGAPRRDLHSVGQFGGNLIDAELVASPGKDNFFEIQPSTNVETVINATSVTILNDGQDGTAAIVESCGPDDLIDYINASSQVAQFGVSLPPGIDDTDYDVVGCTRFVLEPRPAGAKGNYITLTTSVTNYGGTTIGLFPGDYINGMGELEQFTQLDPQNAPYFDAGIGELTATGGISAFTLFGFGEATGVSYGRVGFPVPGSVLPDSSFSTSGVSFVLAANSVPNLLLPGADPPTLSIDPGGTESFSRVFAVGSGSAADVVDVEVEVLGLSAGDVSGCVTVGGVPAPGARVALGTLASGQINDIVTHWVTDAAGCYAGRVPVGSYGVAAERDGTPYEGGGTLPTVHPVTITDGGAVVQDVALPATASLHVEVVDPSSSPIPARVTVVGFDPSPEPVIVFNFLGFFVDDGGTFKDITKDPLPFGVTSVHYTGADGVADFDVEPGSYQVFVSRGTEYSLAQQAVTLGAGVTTNVQATIARVLDTAGFVSSDFHVHSINSPDSRISLFNRVNQFAGEGVENFIATDHDARTDPTATIGAEGLSAWLRGTVGEEITTFDTGHYNGYPLGVDPERPSGGSTDWARAAPPGQDFPSLGAYNRSPAEIHAEVLGQLDSHGQPLNTSPDTVVQINHINSHFEPLRIDTSQTPPQSFLTSAQALGFRLDPSVTNFFHAFPALELWNGSTRGAQSEFLDLRIGVWMNLLNQGIPTTYITDTDTHTFLNLRTAGGRTWTASPTDSPPAIDPDDVGASVLAGRAVGGQGIFVGVRLREADTPANQADLTWGGSTTLTTAADGNVELLIDVQAPVWAEFDSVEVYANAATTVTGTSSGTPVDFSAVPTQILVAGTDFTLPPPVQVVASVSEAQRQELSLTLPFSLAADTWFVVVVKGTDGVSQPMFPVYPSGLATGSNTTLANLLDGNLGESGTMALGASNALYADVDGTPGFQAPGVQVVP